MPDYTDLYEYEDYTSLTFYCEELPADAAVSAAGHLPNGYFWESLVRYLAPPLTAQVQLDCEAGMFAAYGDRESLVRLRDLITPYLEDGDRVAEAIQAAEAAGFRFDS